MKTSIHLSSACLLASMLLAGCSPNCDLSLLISPEGALFTEGADSVLFYQAATTDLQGRYPGYARSNYIHPLYGLDGSILTEDFPGDHLHQRGVFWAWHQLYVGELRIGDGWLTEDLYYELSSLRQLERKGPGLGLQAELQWFSPLWLDQDGQEKALVRERTRIMVHPSEPHYRLIDVDISLLALQPGMRIGGSEDAKGYGGFSVRMRLPEDVSFEGEMGEISPETNPVEAGPWMDISGSLGDQGAEAGIAILGHPGNPGHPQPWILRKSSSMQNAVYPYPGATAVELSMERSTRLRYRLVVHRGITGEEIMQLSESFSIESP